jgi:hypothetical protein
MDNSQSQSCQSPFTVGPEPFISIQLEDNFVSLLVSSQIHEPLNNLDNQKHQVITGPSNDSPNGSPLRFTGPPRYSTKESQLRRSAGLKQKEKGIYVSAISKARMTKFAAAPIKSRNSHTKSKKPIANPEYLKMKSPLNLSQSEAIISSVGVLIDNQIEQQLNNAIQYEIGFSANPVSKAFSIAADIELVST